MLRRQLPVLGFIAIFSEDPSAFGGLSLEAMIPILTLKFPEVAEFQGLPHPSPDHRAAQQIVSIE
jgi:hypothetical protein